MGRNYTGIDVVYAFLTNIAIHNDRTWFVEHRDEYDRARMIFEDMAQQLINRLSVIDTSLAHLTVRDCTYRFYRDTRFSEDKSPYKQHFGTYIAAHGKKAFHGGYYLHIQPGECMIAGGAYCLPSNILKAVRQSIVDETEEFRGIVEDPEFKRLFPIIGMDRLKTLPVGFPRDYPYPEYLRPKDYSIATSIGDDFLRQDDWLEQTVAVFRKMKPFIDFVNYTIDDYE
jgi:uncharacterized protein (TIGR02453 family)